MSLINYDKSVSIARSLGVDPDLAKLAIKTATAIPLVSFAFKQATINNALNLGRLTLKWLGVPGHPLGESRVNAVKRIVAENKSLPLLYPEEDLDYCYARGAMDAESTIWRIKSKTDAFSLRVGARVPHCWFLLGNSGIVDNAKQQRVALSTCDLPSLLSTIDAKFASSLEQASDLHLRYVVIVHVALASQWTDAIRRENLASIFRVMPFHSVAPAEGGGEVRSMHHDILQEQLQEPRFDVNSSTTSNSFDIKKQPVTTERQFISVHRLFDGTFDDCNDNKDSSAHFLWKAIERDREVMFDLSNKWGQLCKEALPATSSSLISTLAVVVRPDGHVAAIYEGDEFSDKSKMNIIMSNLRKYLFIT